MAARDYRQYCGVARALDVVGERWALLIVRDLLVGPRRFGQLQTGLPGIPTNVLTNRLKELEAAGVVVRQVVPAPGRGLEYALTPEGQDLNDAVVHLGRWGARRLGDPREGDAITPDSLTMALRTTFRAASAPKARTVYELRVGPTVVHATVADGVVCADPGAVDSPDLVIIAGPAIRAVMAGELSPQDAVREGLVTLEGDARLWPRFARTFRI